MKVSTVAAQVALGLALLYLAAPLVRAQQHETIAIETLGTTPFMSGGVGQDQRDLMRKAAKDFNLRFEFSERQDNEFIVGTELLITTLQGNPVFVLDHAGPIVNVNLPDGQYRVVASYDGQNETRRVTVRGKTAQDLYFHWKGNPKQQPTAAVDTSATTD